MGVQGWSSEIDGKIGSKTCRAPEIHPPDPLAEMTADLQAQLGASSFGCDDSGNAVGV